jgi:hypothetical protein
MKHKLLDWFLIIVVLIGGVLTWQTGRERSRLTERHGRLAKRAGDLQIADPSKVYVLALDTGEPLHFAWRMSFPPNYKQFLRSRHSGVSVVGARRPSDFIARVRFRQDDQGVMQIYTHFENGSSQRSLGDKKLAEFLRNRRDKLRIEQLGATELAVLEPDQPAVLLRLTLPDDLKGEFEKLFPDDHELSFPEVFELNLGSEP